MNVKMLRSFDVMLPELSMESSVNEGNASAQHFSVKNTVSFHAVQQKL